jgi:Xaa-Pro aminopeptidase
MISTQILKKSKTTAFLVSSPMHLRYLTGVTVEHGYVLLTKSRAELYTSLAFLHAKKDIEKKGIAVFDASALQKRMTKLKSCAFEAAHVTVAVLETWKKKYKGLKFVSTTGIIEELRRVKTPKERQHIQHAWQITKAVLKLVPTLLKTGMSEKELAHILLNEIVARGGDGFAFDPIIAFGSHTSRPHHRATTRTLQKNDIVQIDIGAKVHGYCADGSDVFFVGSVPMQWKEYKKVLQESLRVAKRHAKAGASTRMIDEAARVVLRKAQVEHAFCHALGHGVGLDIHEGVTLSPKARDQALLKHEVIAIEPGIYFPGKFGMRVEETVFVK